MMHTNYANLKVVKDRGDEDDRRPPPEGGHNDVCSCGRVDNPDKGWETYPWLLYHP